MEWFVELALIFKSNDGLVIFVGPFLHLIRRYHKCCQQHVRRPAFWSTESTSPAIDTKKSALHTNLPLVEIRLVRALNKCLSIIVVCDPRMASHLE